MKMITNDSSWAEIKVFTFSLIQKYAPEETSLAELVWEEVRNSPFEDFSQELNPDELFGMGSGVIESAVFSAIVIPVIVGTLTGVTTSAVHAIFDHLRRRLSSGNKQLDEATIQKLAEEISNFVAMRKDQ